MKALYRHIHAQEIPLAIDWSVAYKSSFISGSAHNAPL